MQTKTIDEVLRDCLLNKQYPLHYYVPFLNRALTCLSHLSFDHNFGVNVKQAKVTINSYDRVTIPLDAVDIVSVFALNGDKVLPFNYNETITNVYNLDGVNKIPYVSGISTLPGGEAKLYSLAKLETYASERPQVFHIADRSGEYEYNVDAENSEIIISAGSELSSVFIRYLSSSVSKTAANLIHPYAEPVIIAHIELETARNDGSPQSKVALLKQALLVEKRLLRARMNPLSATDILNTLYFN